MAHKDVKMYLTDAHRIVGEMVCCCCSIGARGYVTGSARAEELAAQDRTCREITDEMISLVEQGRADMAITLFDPDFLLKVCAPL